MLLRRIFPIALLTTASVALPAVKAMADVCNLTSVNSVCGPTAADSTTMTITASSGTYASMVGTYSGSGWTGPTSTGTAIYDQGAIFAQINVQPTGTGVIQSFLRLQNTPTEQGYNTDARDYNNGGNYSINGGKTEFDEKSDPNFTRSIQLTSIPKVTIGGIVYREFFLDINETATADGRLLSLDQLEIFTSSSSMLDNYSAGVGTANSTLTGPGGAGSKLIYSLDTGFTSTPDGPPLVDNYVLLDYMTSSGGSGKGDMVFYLPDTLFTGVGGNAYIYLYSQFGCGGSNFTCDPTRKMGADDTSAAGFEEWWVRSILGGSGGGPQSQAAVPEPTTLILFGTGLLIVARKYRPSMKLRKTTN